MVATDFQGLARIRIPAEAQMMTIEGFGARASDPIVTFTIFDSVTPTRSDAHEIIDRPWSDVVRQVGHPATAINKASCKLISLAEYGDILTAKNCVRHAANVRRIFGVELDYDGEQMPIADAAALLQAANVETVLYTSPSYTPARPRWRVLAPLSDPELPDKRREFVGRLNRILGGVASRESFTLSQSYYIGRVSGAVYETRVTHGRTIEQATDIEPLYHVDPHNDGSDPKDATTDAELREAFERGEGRYQAMLKLSSRWAARGMELDDITSSLYALMRDAPAVNADGIDLKARVPGIAASAVRKFGETRAPQSTPEEREQQEREKQAKPQVNGFTLPTLASISLETIEAKIPLFEGVLFPGAWLIVGRPKIGKSWLLLQLGLMFAQRAPFLGYAAQTSGDVLMILAEDDAARIQSRLAMQCRAAPPENVFVIDADRFRELARTFSASMTWTQFMDAWLEAHPTVRLVIVDTEARCRDTWNGERAGERLERSRMGVIEKDYSDTSAFDAIALRHRAVIALVNHAAKRKGEWADIHELINRTNTALAGASGSLVLADQPDADPLDPRQKKRVLGIRGRDLKDDVLIAVEQESDGAFRNLGDYIEVKQSDAEIEILQAVADLMGQDFPEGAYVQTKDIAEHLGKRQSAVKRSISRMVKKETKRTWEGKRVSTKPGRKGGIRLD